MLHLPRLQHNSRMWRCASALLALAASCAIASDVAEPHHVTAVRFWSLGAVTRIAIETDGDFQLKTDHLENPDRIFFDLTGTRPSLTHKSLTVIPVADHLVKQIRVAEPQRNVTRVVLDLETTVETSTSRLENPDRLIIELRAPGGKAPEPSKFEPSKAPETTTKVPAKTPPTLVVEPTPARKPMERRQFTPPPVATPPPAPPVQAQETQFDPPPVVALKPSQRHARGLDDHCGVAPPPPSSQR